VSLFKAQAHMRDLTQRLQILLPTATITQYLDPQGFPYINVSNTVSASTDSEWIYITTEPDPSNHVNSLGLPQTLYSPHECQIYREAQATAPTYQGERNQVLAQASLMGMKVIVQEGTGIAALVVTNPPFVIPASLTQDNSIPNLQFYATGTITAPTGQITTTVVATIPSDYINPLTQSQ
jgi:hypothetical protein